MVLISNRDQPDGDSRGADPVSGRGANGPAEFCGGTARVGAAFFGAGADDFVVGRGIHSFADAGADLADGVT
jgi:hypothetical protein